MALRAGHGSGAGVPRIEVLPPDELPTPAAGAAAPLADGRDPRTKRIRTPEAARAMARLPRRSKFLPRKIACDPRFEPRNRARLEWLQRRRAELHDATGGVSVSVAAMLNAAGWAYAGGEFAAEVAAETGDVEGFKAAANLTQTARGHDLSAWELAVREGQVRRTLERRRRQRTETQKGNSVE